jgi:hypothetical protein
MLTKKIKTSPHGSFQVTQLCKSIAICEAVKGDKHDWGNATDGKPAFLVYFCCNNAEIEEYIQTFQTFSRPEWCEVRKPKYLKGFEAELKIKGMKRESDSNTFGLDYLVEFQVSKEDKNNFGIVKNGIYKIPAYTRIKLVTFETNDGKYLDKINYILCSVV